MDRVIVYPGQIPLETDVLNQAKYAMMGLGYLARALVGPGPIANGLIVSQTASPSLSVLIGDGSLYQQLVIDQTAFSSIPADTSGVVVKQGINTQSVTLGPVTLPSGSNRQICIVQAKLVEQDTDSVVLPYYNSANPNVALNGPGGAGTSQARTRQVALQFSLKYGVATTGTPSRPSLDAGAVGLAEFELRNTTTGISLAAQSATNAQILQYGNAGDPRVLGPYASLSNPNVFAATQLFQGNVVVSGAASSPTPGAGLNGFPILSQFDDNVASSGSFKIPIPNGTGVQYVYVKWGSFTSLSGGASQAVTFSPAFPNNAWALALTPVSASTTAASAWYDSLNGTGFNGRCTIATTVRYIAIGN